MTTRAEHVAWAKTRAIEYVDRGDLDGAFESMASDLRKYPATSQHLGVVLWATLRMIGQMNSPDEVRKFIEGFQ